MFVVLFIHLCLYKKNLIITLYILREYKTTFLCLLLVFKLSIFHHSYHFISIFISNWKSEILIKNLWVYWPNEIKQTFSFNIVLGKKIFKAHLTFNLNLKTVTRVTNFANKRHPKSKLNFCHMLVLTTFDTFFRPSILMFSLYF